MSDVALATPGPKAVTPGVERSKVEAPHVLPNVNNRFSITESGYTYAEIDVTQPIGHSVEDALRPEYWVHHAGKLKARAFTGEADRAGAIIRLRTDDHAYFAQLYVRAVQDRGLVVQLMGEPVVLGARVAESASFEVKWNVGKRGFDIIRKSDREIVGDGSKFPTRELAQEWIDKTMRTN